MKNIAYMKNSTILGSAKPTFSSAKLIVKKLSIVHCPLSIVNCTLSIVNCTLLIAFCLLFAGSLSAQDNYAVIVKCPVISGQAGYMQESAYSTYKTSYSNSSTSTANLASATSKYSNSLITGARYRITSSKTNYTNWTGYGSSSSYGPYYATYTSSAVVASYSKTGAIGASASSSATSKSGSLPASMTGRVTVTKTASVSQTNRIGFANFNIANMPTSVTVAGAVLSYSQLIAGTRSLTGYGISATPSAANSSVWGTFTTNNYNSVYYYLSTIGSGTCSRYLIPVGGTETAYTTSWGTYYSSYWLTGTYTLSNSNFYSSNHDMFTNFYRGASSASSYMITQYRAYMEMEKARENNKSAYGMAFSQYYIYPSSGMSAATSAMNLLVTYQAPWSVVLTPSAKTPASSACATGGTYTLTASQSMNTSYVSVSPQTWTWYSATASGGPYASIGTTTATAYTVSGRNDPGTVWYRYAEKASMVSNTARSTVTNYYTIGTNLCSPAKIEFKCTPLPSNPTFSATATGNRSVTLTWSGISGTDHYVIRYGVDSGISFKEITVPYGTNTVTIENLTNGREYYFQIQAIGGIEASGCQYCTTQLSTRAHVTPDCDE
ncbi:MAG: fibronectin type III domain-containing protein [Bacteroidales bacterium]|nr:fibronectin type III domain-containing protein [Bacteroidales bacterium]